MKSIFKKPLYSILILSLGLSSCKKFLNVAPDDIPTLAHAFSNKYEAEKYLHTCYSYPFTRGGSDAAVANINFLGGDELWTYRDESNYRIESPWKIALGEQNKVSPWVNAWNGENHAKSAFKAIRDCNIFIENVQKPELLLDLEPSMRERWLAEAKFLKAYQHFILLRMYGPIPITDVNVSISASPDEVKTKRDPVDQVVSYIADLCDEAAASLPASIENKTTEAGRATASAAKMLKARLLLMAASPLFNGNPDYVNFTDKDGILLFNPTYDPNKWVLAENAAKEAIEMAHSGGYLLFKFNNILGKITDTTKIQMNIRGSVTEKWNNEIIWAFTDNSETAINSIQNACVPGILDSRLTTSGWNSYLAVPLKIAEMYYSDKGVPINEDLTFDYANRYDLRTAVYKERFNIKKDWVTAKINFNRENRFYASLGFDGGVWFMQNVVNSSDENNWAVNAKLGQAGGKIRDTFYNPTGYWPKKLVNYRFTQTATSYTTERYPRPEMRLADLYLMYAEALNENGKMEESITWLDKIRERSGLDGVKDSWTNYSNNPTKFTTTYGLREIIQQERMIELAFEGIRMWDLRRWKTAATFQNQPIKGWDINSSTTADYYRIRTLHNMEFISPRDYFWPLKESELLRNSKLVQNPGW